MQLHLGTMQPKGDLLRVHSVSLEYERAPCLFLS